MSLINRAVNLVKSLTTKSYSQVPSESFTNYNATGYLQANTTEEIQQIKSWVYISLDMNARMIASTPLRLYAIVPNESDIAVNQVKKINDRISRRITKSANTNGVYVPDGYQIVELLDHPAIEILHNVNKFRAYQSMMRETIWSMQGTGDAFWYVSRRIGGALNNIPSEIWLLNPARISVVPDKNDFIKGYIYSTGAGQVAIPRNNIIHFREPNLKSAFYGMGRIEAVWGAVMSYDSYMRYERNNANNPIPNVVVSVKGQMLSSSQRRELLAEYDRLISNQGGVMRSNVLGIEDDSVEFKNLSFNPKDMQFIEGRRWNREEITNAFGQSVALFTDTASRANVDGALYRWSKFELDPDCKLIASILTEQLLPMYDTNVPMFFEFDEVTQDDVQVRINQDASDVQNSIRSRNEIRSDRGLPPIDDERANDPFYTATQPSSFALSLDSSTNAVNPTTKTINNGLAKRLSGESYFEDGMNVNQSEL